MIVVNIVIFILRNSLNLKGKVRNESEKAGMVIVTYWLIRAV